MKTISYYKVNKEFVAKTELNSKTVHNVHGMKVRCRMADGSTRIGYANTRFSMEKGKIVFEPLEYITLEIVTGLDNLPTDFDVAYQKVITANIEHIDAILYSGLRWGGVPTNEFE